MAMDACTGVCMISRRLCRRQHLQTHASQPARIPADASMVACWAPKKIRLHVRAMEMAGKGDMAPTQVPAKIRAPAQAPVERERASNKRLSQTAGNVRRRLQTVGNVQRCLKPADVHQRTSKAAVRPQMASHLPPSHRRFGRRVLHLILA